MQLEITSTGAGARPAAVVTMVDSAALITQDDLAELVEQIERHQLERVGFVTGDSDPDQRGRLLAGPAPAARGIPGTDAVKRVEDGIVLKTIDRTTLYTLDLPAVVPVEAIHGALASLEELPLTVADIVTALDSPITLLDATGVPLVGEHATDSSGGGANREAGHES